MRRWIRVTAAVAGGVAASAAAAVGAGSMLWTRASERAVDLLLAEEAAPGGGTFSVESVQGLPAPVARYFRFALTPGQPLFRRARLEQAGEFRGGMDAPWSPFVATQHVSAAPPGFVWDARIRMAPLVPVRVRDSYLRGAGSMYGKLAWLVTVANTHGTPEIASGALQRYLAEAPWMPTALLPGRGVAWEAMDDSTARATLTDAGVTVSIEFTFGPDGGITRAYTPARFRDVGGKGVPTPWEGRFRRYTRRNGMMIPSEGEVEWITPEGRLPYWRGRIVAAEYE